MAQVKICGLKTGEAIETAIMHGADYIGLVHFAKSPRHVELPRAAELAEWWYPIYMKEKCPGLPNWQSRRGGA